MTLRTDRAAHTPGGTGYHSCRTDPNGRNRSALEPQPMGAKLEPGALNLTRSMSCPKQQYSP